jgi:hypothetical protein
MFSHPVMAKALRYPQLRRKHPGYIVDVQVCAS